MATGQNELFKDKFPTEAKAVRRIFVVGVITLGIGAIMGVLQVLHRTDKLRIISSGDYYTYLTIHGVNMVIFWAILAILGTFTWAVPRSLDRSLGNPKFTCGWIRLGLIGIILAEIAMFAGFIKGDVPILGNMQADVLYTFYAPLKAHPIFYIGLALYVIASWLAGFDYFTALWDWKKDNPDERIPLQTFIAVTTMMFWQLASLGIAIEVLFFLLPWSLGIIPQVDPLLTRTLFWMTGHPIVYFWLMPAYLAWYTVLPKLSGGRLFSDPLARVVFILFLLLSSPVGFHHQYMDPGVPNGFKYVVMSNTMFLLLPSLLTAFTAVASMEHGARQRGGTGRLGWLKALPWEKPQFSAMAFAGLFFAAGGFSGMVNAALNLNYLVHNTLWVPGHFHLTVGSAVTLTMMGLIYWLFPQLTGKDLSLKGLAMVQPYLWFIGMTFMSNAMHRAGLAGVPRRTAEPTYRLFDFHAVLGNMSEIRWQLAIGGVFLFISAFAFIAVLVASVFAGSRIDAAQHDFTIPEPLSGPEDGPLILDNLKLWGAIAVVLVLLAYGVPLMSWVTDGPLQPGAIPVRP
ncbi:MAG: b(o/a)3-type cytochrome-c oxidase subunit 1 [Halobacteria archaeon]|nr:b(o/a)3-type cytochrome-c oxidase subunit 1 [Halobacteria archaeon]